MSVASETIVAALKDLLKLEELSISNLADFYRFDLSGFSPAQQKTIEILLLKLREDTNEHEKKILQIIERLSP